jgi:hypothetical protein
LPRCARNVPPMVPPCSLNIVSALWQCRCSGDLGELFVEYSSSPFGLASPPVSLKPSLPRPLPAARNESTGLSESLRAVEHFPGKEKPRDQPTIGWRANDMPQMPTLPRTQSAKRSQARILSKRGPRAVTHRWPWSRFVCPAMSESPNEVGFTWRGR